MKKSLLVYLFLFPLISFGKNAVKPLVEDPCDLYMQITELREELDKEDADVGKNYRKLGKFLLNNAVELSILDKPSNAIVYKYMLLQFAELSGRLLLCAQDLDEEGAEFYSSFFYSSHSNEAVSLTEYIEDKLRKISYFGDNKLKCDKKDHYLDAMNTSLVIYSFYEAQYFCYKKIYDLGINDKNYLEKAFVSIKNAITHLPNCGYTSDQKNTAFSNAFWTLKKLNLNNNEGLDYSLKFIEAFTKLSSTKTSEIFKNKWVNHKDAVKFIDNIELKDKSLFTGGTVHSQMADYMKLLNEKDLAIKYTIKSYNNGNTGAYYTKNSIVYLLDNGDKSQDLLEMINKYRVGIDKTNCDAINEVRNYYTRFGDAAGVASLDVDYKNCLDAAEAEKKRKEKEMEKLERQQRKAARGRLNVAFGTNPIAFFGNDYGINLEFITRKRAFEVGYRGMNDNVEYYVKDVKYKFDGIDTGKYMYNGNRIYVNFKKFLPLRRTGGKAFTGFEASYTTKNFEKVKATVINNSNNIILGTYNFKPVQTQYDAAYIFGIRAARHGFLIELFSGLGASYKKVTENSGYYNNSAFRIDDKLLTTRIDGAMAFYAKFGYRVAFVF